MISAFRRIFRASRVKSSLLLREAAARSETGISQRSLLNLLLKFIFIPSGQLAAEIIHQLLIVDIFIAI